MYVGIDLGGTGIKVGLIDENHNIIHRANAPTLATRRHYSEIIKDMAELAKKVVREAGYDINKDIKSIGIGSPGSCDSKNGVVIYANNLNFINVPLRAEMQKYIGLPVYIGNDANVAALGEFKFLDEDISEMVAITLGTGVGGGVIIDKKIYEGFNGEAAELGHMQVQMINGESCTCGRTGCWEAYASITALVRDTKRAIQAHPECAMAKAVAAHDVRINGKTPFLWAKKGDSVARKVVDNYIKAIAEGIASVINIFQPEILVIGGAISKEGEYLLNPIKEIASKATYSRTDRVTDIRIAKLGNDAGIIGAALLGE